MNITPIPNDPYRAAQMRAAVELELPIVAGVVVLESEEQIVAHRERTQAILHDENVLIRHEAPPEIIEIHLQACKARHA